jgi:hypothetical protein
MVDDSLARQLSVLRDLLEEVDARLAIAPIAPPGLAELKGSVDTLRTNMWAILSAGHGALAPIRIERLKLQRAIEGIKAVSTALKDRPDGGLHPEHAQLRDLARALADQIDQRQ